KIHLGNGAQEDQNGGKHKEDYREAQRCEEGEYLLPDSDIRLRPFCGQRHGLGRRRGAGTAGLDRRLTHHLAPVAVILIDRTKASKFGCSLATSCESPLNLMNQVCGPCSNTTPKMVSCGPFTDSGPTSST